MTLQRGEEIVTREKINILTIQGAFEVEILGRQVVVVSDGPSLPVFHALAVLRFWPPFPVQTFAGNLLLCQSPGVARVLQPDEDPPLHPLSRHDRAMDVILGILVRFQVQVEGEALSTDVGKIPTSGCPLKPFVRLVTSKPLQIHWVILSSPSGLGTDQVAELTPLQLQLSIFVTQKVSYGHSNNIFIVVVVVRRFPQQSNVVRIPA